MDEYIFFLRGEGTIRNGSPIVPDSLVDIQEIKESLAPFNVINF